MSLFWGINRSCTALQVGLTELIRVMTVFRALCDTINVAQPWLSPNATQLDETTFQQWVEEQTTNELARSMMVLAASEQGAVAEPWWASALFVARQLVGGGVGLEAGRLAGVTVLGAVMPNQH